MSNIKNAFKNKKAFIAFFTCGDPDLETTKKAIRSAVKNGADLIELGIPFSDPTAEGPVIQAANLRALKSGITTDKIFAFVRELRKDIDVPFVFMTYTNVVFSYGVDEVEIKHIQSAGFVKDGIRYTLTEMEESITQEDLLEMAREIIEW